MAWADEKEIYADALQDSINGINQILAKQNNRIVTPEKMTRLAELREEAKTLLPKLRHDQFEVAVVGLEKAGKSTFSNALIGLNALPTAERRCTYTATRISQGEDETASVTFYTREEFLKDFRDKLEKLGISNAHLYDPRTLTLEKYELEYGKSPEAIKASYDSTLNEDIRETLKQWRNLEQYVGHDPITFTGLQITSNKDNEFRPFVVDPARAIAVKSVSITSPQLTNKTVLYDVPGFNSPTELHREQTLRRMQSADAIIMVASAKEPSILGEVLRIFKNPDVNGRMLSRKLFVFANKADLANQLEENKRAIYTDWMEKYRILENTSHDRERIVFGSAQAALNEEGASPDLLAEITAAKTNLAAKELADGVGELRDKLRVYQQTERFDVLKERVNVILTELKNMFADVDMSPEYVARVVDKEKTQELFKMHQRVTKELKRGLLDLRSKIRNGAAPDGTSLCIAAQITDAIQECISTEKYGYTDEEIAEAEKRVKITTAAQQLNAVDVALRNAKFDEMYRVFADRILTCTGTQHADASARIMEIFLNAMNVPMADGEFEELKADVKDFCSLEDRPDDDYYQSLIERFGRAVFDILIATPQNQGRWSLFKENLSNYLSLGCFYSGDQSDPNADAQRDPNALGGVESPVWELLLYPEKWAAIDKETDASEKAQESLPLVQIQIEAAEETSLSDVFKKLQELSGLKTLTPSVGSNLKRLMEKHGQNTVDILEANFDPDRTRHKDILEDIRTPGASQPWIANAVEDMLEAILSEPVQESADYTPGPVPVQAGGGRAQLLFLILKTDKYMEDKRPTREDTYETIKRMFNDDITALRIVLRDAVVPAAGLDTAFVAREVRQIDRILERIGVTSGDDLLNSDNPENEEYAQKYIDLLSKYAEVIEAARFGSIRERELQQRMDAAVMEEIRSIISSLVAVEDLN